MNAKGTVHKYGDNVDTDVPVSSTEMLSISDCLSSSVKRLPRKYRTVTRSR